ncbi:hypothetical protein [Alloyangia pacifica]|uniref:Uncharacterized protein n=1 Tax=Alloyangia pacifica TaxID=311180 RepID=A0A1I6QHT6_9RHOB|nr:hypothetical protein [Alloyangia pacifica]SDF90299.1 hypothetical protein SAMN04488245_10183 [Alloyangia pacifica]SFS52043.1 hypothetical protein SAMN04488050_10284 [Alloyangia pacifica]
MKVLPLFLTAIALGQSASAEDALVQPVIDGCIDQLIARGGASRPGGQVIDSQYSEAGSMIFLQDADGRIWQCFGYRDGSVESLDLAGADAAEAALARAGEKAAMAPERIRFAPGTSGAELSRRLEAGGATQFVLGARAGQVLDLRVVPEGGAMYYILRNPDNSILLTGTDAATPFRAELPQSGDVTVEVVSKESMPMAFDLIVTVE